MTEFKSLSAALEGWFDQPFSKLPVEMKVRVLREFPPAADPDDIDVATDTPARRNARARRMLPAGG